MAKNELIPESRTQKSAFFKALNRAVRMPDSSEGVALEMTRIICAAGSKVPTADEFLDLYTVCLRAAEGERWTALRETLQ